MSTENKVVYVKFVPDFSAMPGGSPSSMSAGQGGAGGGTGGAGGGGVGKGAFGGTLAGDVLGASIIASSMKGGAVWTPTFSNTLMSTIQSQMSPHNRAGVNPVLNNMMQQTINQQSYAHLQQLKNQGTHLTSQLQATAQAAGVAAQRAAAAVPGSATANQWNIAASSLRNQTVKIQRQIRTNQRQQATAWAMTAGSATHIQQQNVTVGNKFNAVLQLAAGSVGNLNRGFVNMASQMPVVNKVVSGMTSIGMINNGMVTALGAAGLGAAAGIVTVGMKGLHTFKETESASSKWNTNTSGTLTKNDIMTANAHAGSITMSSGEQFRTSLFSEVGKNLKTFWRDAMDVITSPITPVANNAAQYNDLLNAQSTGLQAQTYFANMAQTNSRFQELFSPKSSTEASMTHGGTVRGMAANNSEAGLWMNMLSEAYTKSGDPRERNQLIVDTLSRIERRSGRRPQ